MEQQQQESDPWLGKTATNGDAMRQGRPPTVYSREVQGEHHRNGAAACRTTAILGPHGTQCPGSYARRRTAAVRFDVIITRRGTDYVARVDKIPDIELAAPSRDALLEGVGPLAVDVVAELRPVEDHGQVAGSPGMALGTDAALKEPGVTLAQVALKGGDDFFHQVIVGAFDIVVENNHRAGIGVD